MPIQSQFMGSPLLRRYCAALEQQANLNIALLSEIGFYTLCSCSCVEWIHSSVSREKYCMQFVGMGKTCGAIHFWFVHALLILSCL